MIGGTEAGTMTGETETTGGTNRDQDREAVPDPTRGETTTAEAAVVSQSLVLRSAGKAQEEARHVTDSGTAAPEAETEVTQTLVA